MEFYSMSLVIIPLVLLATLSRSFKGICLRFRTFRNFDGIISFWEASYETFIWYAVALTAACLAHFLRSDINAEHVIIINLTLVQVEIFLNTWSAIIYANHIAEIPIFASGLPPRLRIGFLTLWVLLVISIGIQYSGVGKFSKRLDMYGLKPFGAELACAYPAHPLEGTRTPPTIEDLVSSWRVLNEEEYNLYNPAQATLIFGIEVIVYFFSICSGYVECIRETFFIIPATVRQNQHRSWNGGFLG
jgi:hypothetical protein